MSWITGVRFPTGAGIILSPPCPDQFWTLPCLLSKDYRRALSPGKETEHEIDNVSPYSIDVKNVLNFTSTSLYVFMAQCWLKSKCISLKCNWNFWILKLYLKHLRLNEVKYLKIKFIQWITRICPDIYFQDPDLNLAWSNHRRKKGKRIKEKWKKNHNLK